MFQVMASSSLAVAEAGNSTANIRVRHFGTAPISRERGGRADEDDEETDSEDNATMSAQDNMVEEASRSLGNGQTAMNSVVVTPPTWRDFDDDVRREIRTLHGLLLNNNDWNRAFKESSASCTAQRDRDARHSSHRFTTVDNNRREDRECHARALNRFAGRVIGLEVDVQQHQQQLQDLRRQARQQARMIPAPQPPEIPHLAGLSLDGSNTDGSSTAREMNSSTPAELPDTAHAHRLSAIDTRLDAVESRVKSFSQASIDQRVSSLENGQKELRARAEALERVGHQHGEDVTSLRQGQAAVSAEQARQADQYTTLESNQTQVTATVERLNGNTRVRTAQLHQQQRRSQQRSDEFGRRLRAVEKNSQEHSQAQQSLQQSVQQSLQEYGNGLQSLHQGLETTQGNFSRELGEIKNNAAWTRQETDPMQIHNETPNATTTELQALERGVQEFLTAVQNELAGLRQENHDTILGLRHQLESAIGHSVRPDRPEMSREELLDEVQRLILQQYQCHVEQSSKTPGHDPSITPPQAVPSITPPQAVPSITPPQAVPKSQSAPTSPINRTMDIPAASSPKGNIYISVQDSCNRESYNSARHNKHNSARHNSANHNPESCCIGKRNRSRTSSIASTEAWDMKRKLPGERARTNTSGKKGRLIRSKYLKLCAVNYDDADAQCVESTQLEPGEMEDPGTWYCDDHQPLQQRRRKRSSLQRQRRRTMSRKS
ncbi:MAG: hypothetical protein LQ352_002335 [Teloschistes flavicans]|nr:MAG: hypothetical protein LQ352_002335 [Teloschistes flavicans]